MDELLSMAKNATQRYQRAIWQAAWRGFLFGLVLGVIAGVYFS